MLLAIFICDTLFEFLFIKYYIYFNSEKIYTDGDVYSDDKIYNENINQVMSLFRCIQKYIPKKKESRTSLFMNMFGFFRKIIDFHNYQMNIYKCLFDEDDQIKTILDEFNKNYSDITTGLVKGNGIRSDISTLHYRGSLRVPHSLGETYGKEKKKMDKKQYDSWISNRALHNFEDAFANLESECGQDVMPGAREYYKARVIIKDMIAWVKFTQRKKWWQFWK